MIRPAQGAKRRDSVVSPADIWCRRASASRRASIVAVRSSATDEDGAAASFAGQYETALNVRGAEAVVAAVLACWAAADSAHLRHYRQRQGLPGEAALVPVLIQQLIDADVSAVA